MKQEKFGVAETGEEVFLYTFENKQGMKMTVSNIGAILRNLWVADKDGQLQDVVFGFDTLEEYEANDDLYLGATIGRNANRIDQARFELNGKEYQLAQNDGMNNLHSGKEGYQLRVWEVKAIDEAQNSITFSLNSPDGDQGYPGDLKLEVTYQLNEEGILIKYVGTSCEDTVFNPTNHSYFNLNGHQSGNILAHHLQMDASQFTPMIDSQSIPTGEILPVQDTPMDFTTGKTIGQDIEEDYEQLVFAKGYDHNFVLDTKSEVFATLTGDQSGIVMKTATDLPGVQLYTGNFIVESQGKESSVYKYRGGMCLETQYFPNAINEANFVTPLLEKNKTFETWTTYTFETIA